MIFPEWFTNHAAADGQVRTLAINKGDRMDMVYAAADMLMMRKLDGHSDEEATHQYCTEMKEKVLNVLRIFRKHGHDEVVLGAWGCEDEEHLTASVADYVAAIFYEAVVEEPETRGWFRRIIFAIPNDHIAFSAFKEAFEDALARPERLVFYEWAE